MPQDRIAFTCPHCGNLLAEEAGWPGVGRRCPICGGRYDVILLEEGAVRRPVIVPSRMVRSTNRWGTHRLWMHFHAALGTLPTLTLAHLAFLVALYVTFRLDPLLGLPLGALLVGTGTWFATMTSAAVALGLRPRAAAPQITTGFGLLTGRKRLHAATAAKVCGLAILAGGLTGLVVAACGVPLLSRSLIVVGGLTAGLGLLVGALVPVVALAAGLLLFIVPAQAVEAVRLPGVTAGVRFWLEDPRAGRALKAAFVTAVVLGVTGLLAVLGLAVMFEIYTASAPATTAELLSASPLGPVLGLPTAVEPGLGTQIGAVFLTLSVSAALALVTSPAVLYWAWAAARGFTGRKPIKEPEEAEPEQFDDTTSPDSTPPRQTA